MPSAWFVCLDGRPRSRGLPMSSIKQRPVVRCKSRHIFSSVITPYFDVHSHLSCFARSAAGIVETRYDWCAETPTKVDPGCLRPGRITAGRASPNLASGDLLLCACSVACDNARKCQKTSAKRSLAAASAILVCTLQQKLWRLKLEWCQAKERGNQSLTYALSLWL